MCGDTPEGALLQEYLTGSSAPSFTSGLITISGGGGGPFLLSWAKPLLTETSIAAQITNFLIYNAPLHVIVLHIAGACANRKWRRERDSNPCPPLSPFKLLILKYAR